MGDQQLLDQIKRLAANQRCLEVHILDHLDEIDQRGLALRRGFSSLFDYAVRELRFTDAAAQRRIQAMRLCRRHSWVRASLQSGELSMTSAAQLETTFASAERAERQSHTGRRNVGQGRCPDQDHDSAGRTRQLGLPAAPGEAGEQGERGPQSTPGLAPRPEQCSGDAAVVNALVLPVANHAVAQNPDAGHAGAPLPQPELNGNATAGGRRQPPNNTGSSRTAKVWPVMTNASPFRAALSGPVSAAPSSDDGPAPQLLPPSDLPAPAPAPVAAPSESLRAAPRVPESSRDDPFVELSPGPVSAPLLHPQRQRELIEQAAGMSTRQVASLLAAAAPEVVPPRDTLRAVAPDRYTLKVTIDQECEQGLRMLKGLLSHLDPRMSWGDLVTRLVREAVTRHDPRGSGSGHRRRREDSASASPRRAPNKTRATGTAAGPAQRVDESSPRAPNRTRATGAPAAPPRRGGGDTPAPQGDTPATERQDPVAMLTSAAPSRQSGPAALLDGARAGGISSGAHAATSAPKFASGALVDGFDTGAGVPDSPVATSAPHPALGGSPDGRLNGASDGAAGSASADGCQAGTGVATSRVATPAPESAPGVYSDGGPSGVSAAAEVHTTRDSVHSRHQSPPRRHIPAAVRRHVWLRAGGRCCYRDSLTGRRCTSSHLLQIDHPLPVAQGGGPNLFNLHLLCFAHHSLRQGHGSAAPPVPPM